MQLTVDTTGGRLPQPYEESDLHDNFAPAIATLATGQHTAIPRTDADVTPDPTKPNNISDFTQAIAKHGRFTSRPSSRWNQPLPVHGAKSQQRGGIAHSSEHRGRRNLPFSDLARQGRQRIHLDNVVDPVTGVAVTFPDLNAPPFGGEDFQTNLIMPEPTAFLSRISRHVPSFVPPQPREWRRGP